MFDAFPDKPRGMHWRPYDRLHRAHDIAEERSTIGLKRFVDRIVGPFVGSPRHE